MNEIESAGSPMAVSGTFYDSPTLMRLPKDRRLKVSTVCAHCPASVWHASGEQIKCYCRVMHLISWSDEEPNELQECDGKAMAEAEMQAKASR